MSILLGNNIKYLRKKKAENQSLLASIVNKGHTTIGNWEKNISEPSIEELCLIANYFEISIDDLINIDLSKGKVIAKSSEKENSKKGKLNGKGIGKVNDEKEPILPVLEPEKVEYNGKYNVIDLDSRAAAGMALIINDVDRYKSLPSLFLPWLGPGFHIRVEITGDSMQPTIKGGDKAIATRIEDVSNLREGAIYLLLDKEEGLVCKRLYFANKNTIELVSDNEIHKPYKRPLTDILAYFKVQEIHTTDLQPPMSEIRREVHQLRHEMDEIMRLLKP